MEKSNGRVKGKNGGISNGSDVATFALVASSLSSRGEGVDRAVLALSGVDNVCTTKLRTGFKFKTECVMSAFWMDLDSVVMLGEEGVFRDRKYRDRGIEGLGSGGSTTVLPTEMLDIGGELSEGQIVHAFIEATVIAALDISSGIVDPDDVLVSTRTESKEATFARVGEKLLARFGVSGFDPDTTTKGTEVGEIIFGASGCFMRRLSSTTTR